MMKVPRVPAVFTHLLEQVTGDGFALTVHGSLSNDDDIQTRTTLSLLRERDVH